MKRVEFLLYNCLAWTYEITVSVLEPNMRTCPASVSWDLHGRRREPIISDLHVDAHRSVHIQEGRNLKM